MRERMGLVALLAALAWPASGRAASEPPIVGSKVFTESVILGEIATQLLRETGHAAEHRRELGGTRVLWSALTRGDIDCYPEYSGTLRAEIFPGQSLATPEQLARALNRSGVWASASLGFNNTYVLGMTRKRTETLGIDRISELANHRELRLGFSNEFMQRADGWPGLRAHYQLPQDDVRGLAHDLAYRGLASGALDVTDLYSTDAEIAHYDLIALEDDRRFFPDYEALFVCRLDADASVHAQLARLAGRIDEDAMIRMNARAKLDRVPEARIAADFLRANFQSNAAPQVRSRGERIWRRTREHLGMVGVSLAAAVLIATPLGVLAFYRPRIGRVVLAIADVLQTLPALALLVFLIPWLGIGYAPAIVALLIYSVLPILRNTYAGLADIPQELRDSAEALGLSRWAQLRHIEMPLAARSIMAGVRTAAVINVGTATLGALIGAGGYGQPILAGIRLDDLGLILEGAIPAALLALLAQALFGLIERRLVAQRG